MEQEQKERLRRAGINLPRGIMRFMGNEGLYERFLTKFPQDKNMGLLEEALQAGDAESGFHAAHTLLGLTSNLSLEVLSKSLRPVTEALRGRDITLAKSNMDDVRASYGAIIEALSQR